MTSNVIDTLKRLAGAAEAVAQVASAGTPIVGSVVQLAGLLRVISDDLRTVPKNPDGSEMTLDQAEQFLNLKITAYHATKQRIVDEAAKNIAEDQALKGGGA